MMEEEAIWQPKTEIGRAVKEGRITNIDDILATNKPIQEPEIVDTLLPNLEEKALITGKSGRPFRMVQRVTDSGRRNRFSVYVCVGNREGYIGIGNGKGKEFGPAIEQAIKRAKLNIIKVPLGCGSWECGCGEPHSLPFKVQGKAGSVRVTLLPAPKGTGLTANEVTKEILELTGLKDVSSMTKGHTKTSINLIMAVFDALRQTNKMKGVKRG